MNDYSWSIAKDCMACGDFPGWFRMKVVDGRPVGFRGVNSHGDVVKLSIATAEKAGGVPLTVDELFDTLDQAYATGAELVEVTYDPTLGYPTHLSVDPSRTTSDDGFSYEVKPLKPTG